MGFLTMAVGEGANFTAYAFAPASLVTSLGALSILVSSFLASKFLNEHLSWIAKLSSVQVILGSIVMVIFAPEEGQVNSMKELQKRMLESGFLTYVAIVIVLAVGLAYFVAPRYGNTNVVVHVLICSLIGSLSVMWCKGLGLSLREIFAGSSSSSYLHVTGTLLLLLLFCISVQMVYLNKALDEFQTSCVNPVHYVLFTSCVMLASAILFEEWKSMNATQTTGLISGFLIVTIALFMLNAFRDVHIGVNDIFKQNSRRLTDV